jgi:hypothetical protein
MVAVATPMHALLLLWVAVFFIFVSSLPPRPRPSSRFIPHPLCLPLPSPLPGLPQCYERLPGSFFLKLVLTLSKSPLAVFAQVAPWPFSAPRWTPISFGLLAVGAPTKCFATYICKLIPLCIPLLVKCTPRAPSLFSLGKLFLQQRFPCWTKSHPNCGHPWCRSPPSSFSRGRHGGAICGIRCAWAGKLVNWFPVQLLGTHLYYTDGKRR